MCHIIEKRAESKNPFPVAWGELERVQPRDFTVHTVPHLIAGRDPWLRGLPEQELSRDLIADGHTIPIARVQAMHEGKRRARARRDGPGDPAHPA